MEAQLFAQAACLEAALRERHTRCVDKWLVTGFGPASTMPDDVIRAELVWRKARLRTNRRFRAMASRLNLDSRFQLARGESAKEFQRRDYRGFGTVRGGFCDFDYGDTTADIELPPSLPAPRPKRSFVRRLMGSS